MGDTGLFWDEHAAGNDAANGFAVFRVDMDGLGLNRLVDFESLRALIVPLGDLLVNVNWHIS